MKCLSVLPGGKSVCSAWVCEGCCGCARTEPDSPELMDTASSLSPTPWRWRRRLWPCAEAFDWAAAKGPLSSRHSFPRHLRTFLSTFWPRLFLGNSLQSCMWGNVLMCSSVSVSALSSLCKWESCGCVVNSIWAETWSDIHIGWIYLLKTARFISSLL